MNLPNNIKKLAKLYNVSTKTISREFKRLAYQPPDRPPKKLGTISPKRVLLFYSKYGRPEE